MWVLFHISMFFFFFNDTATTEIYTLSLHDALPIFAAQHVVLGQVDACHPARPQMPDHAVAPGEHRSGLDHATKHSRDRKSTRLNSSHANISYAVFCLKKKNTFALQCLQYN